MSSLLFAELHAGGWDPRERLEKHYGADYQMVLKSDRGHGVTVSMVLPFAPAEVAAGA